jgi:hypothetical protein
VATRSFYRGGHRLAKKRPPSFGAGRTIPSERISRRGSRHGDGGAPATAGTQSAAVNRYRETQVVLIAGSTLALLIAALSGWRVAKDRTERKKAEDALKSLNRLYAMATGISASMVRVRDRTDLFNRACRTAVEQGEFEMAWIAVIDPTENRIVPVAWAGHDEPVMSTIKAHFSSNEGTLQGNTLAARASERKRPLSQTTYRPMKVSSLARCTPSRVFARWPYFH